MSSVPATELDRPEPSPASLDALVAADTPIAEIAAFLDALTPEARWAQIDGTSRAMQARLWELAETSEPLTLDDFVPAGTPPLVPVVHRGWNSLRLPKSWRRFAKPMCRAPDGSHRLFGYNEAPSRWIIGPGYFVLHGTEDEPRWRSRGAQVVDYYHTPDLPVPESWPGVRPNWLGLQLLIYHQTRDFMRKVSAHVTIGSAYKWDRDLSSYFILVREPGR